MTRNKSNWLKKADELQLKNNYLLTLNFKSTFSQYFNIFSIPHYLIIDKKGKIISSNAARPSKNDSMSKMLDMLIH